MADMKVLSNEMEKLKRQIRTIFSVSAYRECGDLSALEDWEQIKGPDDRQKLEEYRNILDKLDEVHDILSYYGKPIREVSRIHRNENGQYETGAGHCYTCGSGIEFLRAEEIFNSGTGKWEKIVIWTASRMEHNGIDYYIVGYPDIELSGLKVRIRG